MIKDISVLGEKLKAVLTYLKANPEKRNLGLAAFNLLLIFILLFQFNLIGLFATGYEAADLLVDLEQTQLDAIEIHDPDFKNKKVRLVRQKEQELEHSQWYIKESQKEASFFSSFYNRVPAQYAWQLEVYDTQTEGKEKTSKTEKKEQSTVRKAIYSADVQRVVELFESLKEARRYYAVPRTPEKEKAIGMQKDSQGKYANLQINFVLSPEKKISLYLGRTSSGRENYVRRDEEKNIYLVQTDIRSKSGSAEPEYFRDRRILSNRIQEKGILSLMARKKEGTAIAHFVHNGKEWNLQFPNPTLRGGKVRSGAIQSFIQDMLSWKASAFPESPSKALDSRYAFQLVLRYKERETVQEKELVLQILGREGYSDYFLAMPDQSLRKVSSVYLEDILDPLKNFTEPPQKK